MRRIIRVKIFPSTFVSIMDALTNELIELLNQKNKAAFEVVFGAYYPRLVYFAAEYVSHEEAKGLVQDAFVAFWEKNPALQNNSQLQSYLYTSVKNNCLMRLRREQSQKKYINEAEYRMQNQLYVSALTEMDTSALTFQEIELIIQKTMEELPPRCREVFVESRFNGKKNHEVAKALNISEKAVEAQITKALKTFRITLKDYLPLVAYLFLSR
ncbi:RNA polymerase sigma-70 factor [Prolixibacteraceae bacterium JC049]|nr:RNA polymerase sigma-70 factor [Prolixibacteraceae bacterium JC049]